jgi:precorrin-2 dehydrogenase/sirohydrochlorin ferrochelatase
MFPLMLDVTDVPIFLIGNSTGLQPRVDALISYGATRLYVFLAPGDAGLRAPPTARVRHIWPDAAEFAAVWPKLVFISDADDADAARWRSMAHTVGAFVHVQDRIPLCDFHMPAILRHGHLQVTVSTDGVAPGLARILRNHLSDHVFGPEWSARVNEVRAARDRWRGEGLSTAKLGAAIADFMRTRGWLRPR